MFSKYSRALWFDRPNHSIIKESILPELERGQIKLKTYYSGISPGTERLVYQGMVSPSLKDEMHVPYMEGNFSFPIKYGYSLVGKIIEGDELHLGKTVQVMHPHQDIAIVNMNDIRFLPSSISPERATLLSNLETCVNAIWDSRCNLGDKILIVGFGAIGSLLSLTLKQMNLLDLWVVDIDEEKRRKASNFGLQVLSPDQVEPGSFDISFHCSTTAFGLQSAIDAVGQSGTIIELCWYGTNHVNIHLNTQFHIKRKKLISSQVATIPNHQLSRWDYNRRINLVISMLVNSEFDKLITSKIEFNDLPSHFVKLATNGNKDLSLLVKYEN